MTVLTLTNVADAARIIERFRGFHDALIKSITIQTNDEFLREDGTSGETQVSQTIAERCDVQVTFKCPAFGGPGQGSIATVLGRFFDVSEILWEFSPGKGWHPDWTIELIEFPVVEVTTTGVEGVKRFEFVVRRQVLNSQRCWQPIAMRCFRFGWADFRDLGQTD